MRISDWSSDVCSSDLDIADACACSRSRLYHYFDSKEALLREMLATHVDALLQQCQDVASGSRDPETKFRQIVKLNLEIRTEERRVGDEGVSTCRDRWWMNA